MTLRHLLNVITTKRVILISQIYMSRRRFLTGSSILIPKVVGNRITE